MKKALGKLVAVVMVFAMLCPMIGAYAANSDAANSIEITGVKVTEGQTEVENPGVLGNSATDAGLLQLSPNQLLQLTLKLSGEGGAAVAGEELTYLSTLDGSTADGDIQFIDQQMTSSEVGSEGTVTIQFRPRQTTEPGVYQMMANALGTSAPLKRFYKSMQALVQPTLSAGATEEAPVTVADGGTANVTISDYTDAWADPVASPAPPKTGMTLTLVKDDPSANVVLVKDGDYTVAVDPDESKNLATLTIKGGTANLPVGGPYQLVLSSDKAEAYNDITFYLTVEEKTYTVNYDKNGGEFADPGNATLSVKDSEFGDKQTLLTGTGITKANYALAGWTVAPDGTGSVLTEITKDAFINGTSITLYAKWTPVSYGITYELDGGTNHADNPATYTVESNEITLKAPTKAGYTFGGWFSDQGYSTEVTTIAAGSTGAKTLYAKWERISKSVTSEFLSGENAPINAGAAGAVSFTSGVTDGKANSGDPVVFTVTAPAGYNVTTVKVNSGEAIEASNGAYTFTMGDVDAKINIAVTPITYTIKFDTNEGSTNPADITGTVETLPNIAGVTSPTRANYTFAGWYTSKTAGDRIDATALTAAKLVSLGTSVTLYAQWIDNRQATLTYAPGGEDVTGMPNPTIVSGDPSSTIQLAAAPSRVGYTFTGWTIGGELKQPGADYTLGVAESNVDATATWTANQYTITLDAQGGSGAAASISGTVVELPTLPANMTKTGYTFKGWFTAATEGTKVDSITAANLITYNGQTLYAQWTEVKVSGIEVSASPETITAVNGTSTFTATVTPATALNQSVDWTMTKENGEAIDAAVIKGEVSEGKFVVTALQQVDNLRVKVTATSKDGSDVSGEKVITVDIAASEYMIENVNPSTGTMDVTKKNLNDSAFVIVALYQTDANGTVLVKASIKDITNADSRKQTITIDGAFSADAYTNYKVFMWDGLGSMKNLCLPVTDNKPE